LRDGPGTTPEPNKSQKGNRRNHRPEHRLAEQGGCAKRDDLQQHDHARRKHHVGPEGRRDAIFIQLLKLDQRVAEPLEQHDVDQTEDRHREGVDAELLWGQKAREHHEQQKCRGLAAACFQHDPERRLRH